LQGVEGFGGEFVGLVEDFLLLLGELEEARGDVAAGVGAIGRGHFGFLGWFLDDLR
jgi:hypothetical protein